MTKFSFTEAFAGKSFAAKPQMAEGLNICHFTELRPYFKVNAETQEEELKGFWLSSEEYSDIFVRLFGTPADLANPSINWNLANLFAQLEIDIPSDEALIAAKGKQMFAIREDKDDFTNYYFRQRADK